MEGPGEERAKKVSAFERTRFLLLLCTSEGLLPTSFALTLLYTSTFLLSTVMLHDFLLREIYECIYADVAICEHTAPALSIHSCCLLCRMVIPLEQLTFTSVFPTFSIATLVSQSVSFHV